MKNIAVVILILLFVFFGLTFSLMAIYSSPDGKVHYFEASMFWIGNSIALLGLIYYFKNNKY
jgi:ABC-type arginine transport system permease subunit